MSDYFDRIERQLVRSVKAGVPRSSRFPIRLQHLAPIAAVLVVVAVAGVFLGARGRGPGGSAPTGHGLRIVFTASVLDPRSPAGPAIERSIRILRVRLHSLFHDVEVTRAGNRISVVLPEASSSSRGRIVALAAPGRLAFYDWEANALTPNGRRVASQLQAHNSSAFTISQGSGSAASGDAGAGSMNLYDAVKLAAQQPAQLTPDSAQRGSQYYMFGDPGSAACATAAKDQGTTTRVPGVHCLLAGPQGNQSDLLSALPRGVARGQELVIKPGTVLLQAADSTAGHHTSFADPKAEFFVLRDRVWLVGDEVTHPRQRRDQSGSPDLTFSLTSKGAEAFHKATSAIAHRGNLVSGLGQTLNQHFAVALDGKLLTVPQIDFKTYPDGIPGRNGADIAGGFTTQAARDLATVLAFGPLSVYLKTQ